MRDFLQRVFLCLLVLGVAGCASSGSPQLGKADLNNLQNVLVKGKTSKEEVVEILGGANDVDFDQLGQEKWTYIHIARQAKPHNFIPIVSTLAGGTDDLKKKLVLVFDDKGVLLKHTFSSHKAETKWGIMK
jgi:hypothetical protein